MTTFSNNTIDNAAPQEKFSEFVKQVAGEMSSWESSGLWKLSALSPMKDYPLIPGFEDTSPEELRVGAYQAKHDPALMQEYQKMLADKMSRHLQLRQALRANTPEVLQMLKNVYAAGIKQTSGSMFGTEASAGGSVFGGGIPITPASTTSLFGVKPAQGSTFGGTSAFGSFSTTSSPVVGGAPSGGSIFGANQQQTKTMFGSPGSSAFAMTSPANNAVKPSVFGASNNQPSSSLFGGQTQSGQTSSLFGGSTTASSSNSVFGNNSTTTSVFGAATSNTSTGTSSVFGASPGVSRNLFGGGGGASVFGSLPASGSSNAFGSTSSSVFGGGAFSSVSNAPTAVSNASMFGGQANAQPQQQSVFGSPSTAISNSSTSIFGGNSSNSQQQQSSVFGSSTITPQQPSSSVFGGGSMTSLPVGGNGCSIFGGEPSTIVCSVFGSSAVAPPTQSSMFGGGNTNPNSTSSGSLFGTTPASTTTIFGSNSASTTAPLPDTSDERYTPMDKLTESDRIQYQSDKFTYVPLMPPPRELCF